MPQIPVISPFWVDVSMAEQQQGVRNATGFWDQTPRKAWCRPVLWQRWICCSSAENLETGCLKHLGTQPSKESNCPRSCDIPIWLISKMILFQYDIPIESTISYSNQVLDLGWSPWSLNRKSPEKSPISKEAARSRETRATSREGISFGQLPVILAEDLTMA